MRVEVKILFVFGLDHAYFKDPPRQFQTLPIHRMPPEMQKRRTDHRHFQQREPKHIPCAANGEPNRDEKRHRAESIA